MNGDIPSQISIKDPTIQLIGLALFFNSVMIQRRILKDVKQKKADTESRKAAQKQERIDNDKHGRGRFLEPDILTQAAIQERMDYYDRHY